jgi:hypothetical protein
VGDEREGVVPGRTQSVAASLIVRV